MPKDVATVNLQGLGEPMLHPEFPELVRVVRSINPEWHLTINSNGTLLEDLAESILSCGLDEIYVSLNSADPDAFAHSRGGAQLEIVANGVKRLCELRGDSPVPTIKLRTVILAGTDPGALVGLARDLGVDAIAVQELGLDGDWIDPTVHELQIESEALDAWMADLEAQAARVDIVIEPFLLSRDVVCTNPLESMNVLSSGEVTPCCTLTEPSVGVVGDTSEESLDAIWSSSRFAEFRSDFVRGVQPACLKCPAYRPWSSRTARKPDLA